MGKNVLIRIEYDGTNFCGWQIQPRQRTVQGEIEHVLKYKNPNGVSDAISEELSDCADVISETDARMQEIYKSLFGKKME